MKRILEDRREAGRLLAAELSDLAGEPDYLVMALPRGGVVTAYEIATALRLPLDVCIVRKLGVPAQPELAMGAIASGGVVVWNTALLPQLAVAQEELNHVVLTEQAELERRERVYRGSLPLPSLRGKTVILVDDGIATGATAEAAALALKQQGVARLIFAVGVASSEGRKRMAEIADEVVCLIAPRVLNSIGEWYRDFRQVTDEEVLRLMGQAAARRLA